MILVAFDAGALDTSGGPVSWLKVKDATIAGSIFAAVVSPGGPPGANTFVAAGGLTRDSLALSARSVRPAFLRLYVSSKGDQVEAQAAGFAYVDAGHFARGMG